MSGGAHVTSFRALEDLDLALARFAAESEEALGRIAPEVQRKLRVLEDRMQQCEREVQYWQYEYDGADPDEDDLSYISYKMDQAEDHLRNISHWQRRATESHENYERMARRFQDAVISQSPRAQGFVRQKLRDLGDYVGLKVTGPSDGSGGNPGSSGLLGRTQLGTASPGSALNGAAADSQEPLSTMQLPQGFEWISLDRIAPGALAELEDLQYLKDDRSPADFVAAMKLLRERILPEIKLHGNQADADYFWNLDQQNGQQTPLNSLQEVYRICFGSEPIWLDRFVGDPYFAIGGGRHRIKAALELGWNAVPAKVMQASLRKDKAS